MVFFRGKKIYQGFCFLPKLLPHSESIWPIGKRGNDRPEAIWVQVQKWVCGWMDVCMGVEDIEPTENREVDSAMRG